MGETGGKKTLRHTRETHNKCQNLTIENLNFLGYFNKSKNNREEMMVGRKKMCCFLDGHW